MSLKVELKAESCPSTLVEASKRDAGVRGRPRHDVHHINRHAAVEALAIRRPGAVGHVHVPRAQDARVEEAAGLGVRVRGIQRLGVA